MSTSSPPSGASIERRSFGRAPDGRALELFVCRNAREHRASFSTFGATLTGLESPDREGRLANVTLGCASGEDYVASRASLGCVVGRYANRIAGARFEQGGQVFQLDANEGPNHLHGGGAGFGRAVWLGEPVEGSNFRGVGFRHESPDGEAGYPGHLDVRVLYRWFDDDTLAVDFEARTDRPTIVGLAQHAYWNLSGAIAEEIDDHVLWVAADHFVEVDAQKLPTGLLAPVSETALDFRRARRVGGEALDHCSVLRRPAGGDEATAAACLLHPQSGRRLEILTSAPGLQIYTGDGLEGGPRSGGHASRTGLCLEAERFPDAPNQAHRHWPGPGALLRPHEVYRQTSLHRFLVDDG